MAWFNEIAFKRTGDMLKRSAAAGEASFGPFVKRLTPVEDAEQAGWVGEADWVLLQQDPLRARLLLRVVGVTLVVLLVWAAFAKVDEVTRGEARVVPTSQVQVVQSVDGGIVEELLVKEGQVVEAGQ
jgi:adhesin transport system membrane fusion protein